MKKRYFILIGVMVLLSVAYGMSMADESTTRVTNEHFETIVWPEANGFDVLGRIPQNTEVSVLEKTTIQDGEYKVNWYRIAFGNLTGWVSGLDFKDSHSERKYSMTYGSPGGHSRKRKLLGGTF